ncbi:MAG: hypothetical protein KDC82_07480 [Bacteroidetes bacterium]|nr:hypothetical protein [Bacteroidota bacterium]
MKNIVFLFIVLSLLSACEDEDAPRDVETNRYYSDLLKIHQAYDSLGNQATLLALDKYLEEFPELPDAYLFKGYILGKMGEREAAYHEFELALESDSNYVACYEQYSSFLLYDSLRMNKCKEIIELGISLSDSSAILYNNFAWYELLEQKPEEAKKLANQGLLLDSKNKNLQRSLYSAAYLDQDTALLEKTSQAMLSSNYTEAEIVEISQLLESGGSRKLLNSLLE